MQHHKLVKKFEGHLEILRQFKINKIEVKVLFSVYLFTTNLKNVSLNIMLSNELEIKCLEFSQ